MTGRTHSPWGQDHCRHPACPDTNWGGYGRVHLRDEKCPPDPQGKYLTWEPRDAPPGRGTSPITSAGWGACKACGHPQHVSSGCYKPMTGRRCECPPQPKEKP